MVVLWASWPSSACSPAPQAAWPSAPLASDAGLDADHAGADAQIDAQPDASAWDQDLDLPDASSDDGPDLGSPLLQDPLADRPVVEVVPYQVRHRLDGAVWSPRDQATLINDEEIMRVDAATDQISPWGAGPGARRSVRAIGPGQRALGSMLDARGQLALAWFEADGQAQVVTSSFEGQALPSPNDVVYHPSGHLYFTRRKGQAQDGYLSDAKGHGAVFRVSPAGQVQVAAASPDLANPNGIAVSPDGRWLYVTTSSYDDPRLQGVWKLSVSADGSLDHAQRFIDHARPDGMAVDAAGNLYVTSATTKKVGVYSAQGRRWGELDTRTNSLTHCGFGGADGKTLYITAQDKLLRVQLPIPGATHQLASP